MIQNTLWAGAAALALTACTGGGDGCTYTPLLGTVGSCGTDGGSTNNGTGATAKLLTGDYTASRIEYDAATDQLIVESLPFDDPSFEGRYDRAAALDVTGYKAYRSTGGADTYLAYYGTSSTGNTSAAIVAQGGFAQHGHAGAGYSRSGSVTLPSAGGAAVYNGAYVGLRTVANGTGNLDGITADVLLEADFADDKIRGFIRNRALIPSVGTPSAATAGGDIHLVEATILREEANVTDGTVSGAVDGVTVSGTWEALFGGPNGEEVAGVVVFTHGDFRETGTFIAEQ